MSELHWSTNRIEQMHDKNDKLETVHYPDYGSIGTDDITAIADDAMRFADLQVEKIIRSGEATWNAVMVPLQEMHVRNSRAFGRAEFMAYVHPDETIRETAVEAETNISRHSNDLWYNEELYKKVKAFSETEEARALEGEEARLLQDSLRDFRRLGHELEPDRRARMQELNRHLIDNGIAFDKNIRDDKTTVRVSREELEGMPEWWINELEQNDNGTYRVTMEYPHVNPILDQAINRETRRKVNFAYNSRVTELNRPLLEESIKLRKEYANLLGYPSWAHYKLEKRMAKTPEAVKNFYAELIEPITKKAKRELAVLTEMLHADGYKGPLQRYDWRYYDVKLRERDHGVNPEKIAEYFQLDNVLDGLFEVTGETFGLKYRKISSPTWHKDVQVFAIDDADTGEHISTFYMDLFPRDGKYNHAAAFTLEEGYELADGTYNKPSSSIVANFTKPTADRPSLLKYDEVNTLFHEFGHILHQTLTRARLPQFSGTSVEGDFVEAPSQIMEHWTEEPDILQRFAKHYKTGEPIPAELVEGMVAAQKVNLAIRTLRQMSFGFLDMSLHDESDEKDLDDILRKSNDISLLPFEEGTFMPAAFGHLFGYDAGYYGYMWSEVYGDDMFSRFKREGLTNPSVGLDYRHKILERGGTLDAIDMLHDFLGRAPNNEAFLENQGISHHS